MEWNSLFSNIKIGEIEITHLSSASLIEIYVKDSDSPELITLTYRQFNDLIEAINGITTS